MSLPKNYHSDKNESTEQQWKNIYTFGAVTALVVIISTIFDIIIGTVTGGDLSAVPHTAIEKFAQFQDNWLLGLYNLDMLNYFTTILMVPTYFALCAAHRRASLAYTLLAMVIYFIGAAAFITNNAALPILELSSKYAAATTEGQKILIAAAGEAMVARGAHGSPGAFAGYFLPAAGSLVMAFGMLKGGVFSRPTGYVGISGGLLILVYVILVTFVPAIKNIAVMVAAPGGLLVLTWMIMFTIRLFRLGRSVT